MILGHPRRLFCHRQIMIPGIAGRHTVRMTQFVTRMEDRLLAEIDRLIADGTAASRSEAVRLALEQFVDQHRRQRIGAEIVAVYRSRPQTEGELAGLEEATSSLVNEEPW